ncbi:MAG: hypothetical protein PHW00_03980 [Clostridia bacterium]|nr:hypothetical protein [Clostridia bacterium]
MLCLVSGGNNDGLVLTILILIAVVILLVGILVYKLRKHKDPRKNLDIQQPEFVNPQLNKDNEMFISLVRNVTYNVGEDKDSPIKPGSYIVRSSRGKESFNIRYNGLVSEFINNQKIVLGNGDSLCCVSDTLVLIADL